MMKHIYLIVFLMIGVVLVCLGQPSKAVENYRRQVNQCLQSGNAESFSNYFRDMVELVLNQSAETYSKSQATSILNDFFRENPPAQFEEAEVWKDENVIHVVGDYTSSKGPVYRVHYAMKKMDASQKTNYLVYSINIEQTKKCRQKTNSSRK